MTHFQSEAKGQIARERENSKRKTNSSNAKSTNAFNSRNCITVYIKRGRGKAKCRVDGVGRKSLLCACRVQRAIENVGLGPRIFLFRLRIHAKLDLSVILVLPAKSTETSFYVHFSRPDKR